jgi:uncharacterized membrane protein YdbT with pleckstrin-like domain
MVKERILYRGEPKKNIWIYWTLSSGLGILFIATFFLFIGVYFFMTYRNYMDYNKVLGAFPLTNILILFAVLLFIIIVIYNYYLRKTYKYIITSKGVIFEGGIIYRFKKNVPFHKITNAEVTQGLIQRAFGFWDLHVHTAGTGGFLAEIVFSGLEKSEKPRDIILKILKKYQKSDRYGD